MPTCAIYKVGTSKYSAYAYAGYGPTNLYFNQESLTDVDGVSEVANAFRLDQNYPNPFNPSTTIRYALTQRAVVTMSVYNMLGQEVAVLRNAEEEAGYHAVRFDAAGLASGVYWYRLTADNYTETRKMLLVR
jgi:hypothetical protein